MENSGGLGYQGSGAGADDSGYDQSSYGNTASYQADNYDTDEFSGAQGQGRQARKSGPDLSARSDQSQAQGQGWNQGQGDFNRVPLGPGRQGPSAGDYGPGSYSSQQPTGYGMAQGSSTGIGGSSVHDDDPAYAQRTEDNQQQRGNQGYAGDMSTQGTARPPQHHKGGIGGMVEKAKKAYADLKGDDPSDHPRTGGHGSF